MRIRLCLSCISLWVIFSSVLFACSDPFESVTPNNEEEANENVDTSKSSEVMLGSLMKVKLRDFDVTSVYGEPQLIPQADYPIFPSVKRFNEKYEVPGKVWKVVGGHFVAYDIGEFGGALFFMAADGKDIEHVADGHFDQMALLDFDYENKGRSYVLTGGLSHLGSSTGHVSTLVQQANGSWVVKPVIKSESGEPVLVGVVFEYDMLAVVIDEPLGIWDSATGNVDDRGAVVFGLSRDAALSFIGSLTPAEEKDLWKNWAVLQEEAE